ncbi:transglycosylase domain-containing protein [Paenibacillus ehimensis]|uniref:PBP1A family penicillin-binding protein n=1 Tax=Paenibacillus ehimensis TaxID=79264 RepID=A0ABT8VGD3_9BACL|nr:PBP1A family penicillin-binding protein [Paenibacillus ehimensis]MDO3680040.1 PBP1A family penicillin-binding protein [Paenibacillus ehimensis]
MTGRNSRTPGQAPKEKKPTSSAKPKKKKKITLGKVLAWTFVAGALAAICGMGVYIFILVNGAKILKENIGKLNFSEASIIYDAGGNEAGILKVENRENVEPNEIPELLKQAFIATEDQRFEQHQGVDLFSVGRALVKDIVARSMVEGGSTITQQLAKNVFLSSDKTFFRKATEMSIALALEREYKKEEIITAYLNRIYFGNRAYGVKAASKVYFGVSNLNDLKLWQMATLAAMPKAPNTYNPISNPDKSKDRRAVVLKLMQEQGYITEAQRAEAVAAEYTPPANTGKSQYQTYIDYVLKEAQDVYKFDEDDLLRGGYKIYTTLDPNAQQIMEQTYANDKLFQKDGPEQKMQSSMVILNNEDGGIVAMIGGRDYVARGLNRAVAQPRQPGSSFKTLVAYAPAIESGKYNPYSRLPDVQKSYNGYSPRNYDGVYRGEVSMFDAVKKSMNLPAVDLLNQIGVKTGIDFVKKLGIELDDKNDRNLAIALGGLNKGVTTLQMARAYSAFPNNGNLPTAHAITKIVKDKEVIPFKGETKSVMSAKTAWYMTQLMQGVVEPGGTGTAAKFNRPVAGKTGSTQLDIKGLEKYNRDLWFVGYTPEWTAAVWMGFDKTDSKHYVSMSSGSAGVIFKEVMQKALAKRPMTSFKRPDGVKDLTAPPKGITDLKAEHVVMGGNSKVQLSWGGVGDNMTYQIFRKDSKMSDFPAEPLESTTMTEFSDRLITQPDTYEYVVVPYNAENNTTGARSNVATVTIDKLGGNPLDPLNPGTEPNGKLDPNSPDGKPGTDQQGTTGQPGNNGPGTDQPGQEQRPDREGGTGTDGRTGSEQGTKPGTGQGGGTRPGGETSQPGGGTGAGTDTGRTGTESGTDTRTGTNGTNVTGGTNSGTQTNGSKGQGTSGTGGGKSGTGTGSGTDAAAGGSSRGGSGATGGATGSGASTGTTDGAGTSSAPSGSTTQSGTITR